ncbi:MAG: metallophosphoesterase [Coriobacteriales bacterium]|nr:metallophosphoesterase [Coriobacteriales bacterium]
MRGSAGIQKQRFGRLPSRLEFCALAVSSLAAAGLAPAMRYSRAFGDEAAPWQDNGIQDSSGLQDDGNISLILATDIHYLSPELIAAGKLADVGVISSGTMLTSYTDAIADAMVDAVIGQHPHAFIMPGDLTYNAEKESHRDFLPKLECIAAAGIPVLVIPGNHDALTRTHDADAQHFTPAEWFTHYEAFGLDTPPTLSTDQDSASYMWEASPRLRLLFMDVNAVPQMGVLPASTLKWAEDQLKNATQAGARVVGFSHQNLLGSGGYNGLMIDNAHELEALYEKYHVIGNFSGHMHGQSIMATNSGLFDVITASLAIYPHRFATIDIAFDGAGQSGSVTYMTHNLDVSAWAQKTGSANPDLLDFVQYGRNFTYRVQYNTMYSMLLGLGASQTDAHELSDYFAELSCAYAEGTQDQIEPRQDLLDRFLAVVGDSTAARFAYAFDPTIMRHADEMYTTFGEI